MSCTADSKRCSEIGMGEHVLLVQEGMALVGRLLWMPGTNSFSHRKCLIGNSFSLQLQKQPHYCERSFFFSVCLIEQLVWDWFFLLESSSCRWKTGIRSLVFKIKMIKIFFLKHVMANNFKVYLNDDMFESWKG